MHQLSLDDQKHGLSTLNRNKFIEIELFCFAERSEVTMEFCPRKNLNMIFWIFHGKKYLVRSIYLFVNRSLPLLIKSFP